MTTVFLKPLEGRVIRNPDNFMRPIADDGELVEFPGTENFWARCVSNGDAVIIPETKDVAPRKSGVGGQ